MFRSLIGVFAWGLLLVSSSQSATIYQQTFATDTSDLLTTYGFSQSGLTGSATVTSNRAAVGGDANWKIWTATQAGGYTYDWSNPLTFSASVGSSNSAGVGQVAGLFIGVGTGAPGAAGLVMEYYWPTPNDVVGFVADGNLNNRINGVFPATTKTVNGSSMYEMALSIRQNAGNSANFDVKWTVNGINQKTTDDGWALGYSKATYGIGGTPVIGTIGMRNDGVAGTQYYENLTLAVVPEPAKAGLVPLACIGGLVLLRRKGLR